MVAGTTRNLFIQIGGSASDLTIASKAGKSALLEIGDTADDVQATVRSAFEKLGGSVGDQAKAMEQAYSRTFANIRATAQTALKAPTQSGAGLVLNISAARQEADQAQASASFLRSLSDAQARLVETGAEATSGAKSLAVSLELQAIAAEKNALAARESAVGLERLAAESGIAVDGLNEVAVAHGRMGVSGQIAEHVVRSFSDSITAGQSPVRAFALELPRLAEALQFLALETNATEGALGTFAKFMGGPMGLAITLVTSLLAPLVVELLEGGHASDDMKGKVLSLVDALSAEKFGTEAATKALQEYNAEKQKARDNDSNATARTLAEARQRVAEASARRDQYLQQAQALLSAPNSPDESAQATRGAAAAQLKAKADAESSLISSTQQSIRNAEIDQAQEAAKAAVDPIEAIRQKYKHLSDAAEEAASKSDKLAGSLKGVLSGYAAAEASEIKAEEAKKRSAEALQRDNRQSGRQVSLSQAEDIVHSIGGRVTSAQRTTAEQSVLYDRYKAGTGSLAAKPGTSDHETGHALDVAKGVGISLATIRKAFEDAGVHIKQLLDEGNHYHVAFGSSGPRGPSEETLARRAAAAQVKGANVDDAFQNELRAALDGYAGEQARLPQTPDQRFATDTGKAQDDFIQRSAGIEDQVAAGKLTAAQAKQIAAILYLTEQLQEQGATLKRDTDLTNEEYDLQEAALGVRQDLARLDEQMAPTRAARLALEKQILAAEQQAYRDQLDRDIANAQANPEAAQKAVIAYQSIDQREAKQNAGLDRQYAWPINDYRNQLTGAVGDVGDDVQKLQVSAIGHIGDEFEQAAQKALHLHGILGDIVGDFIKLAAQRLELSLVNSLFPASGSGGAGGGISGFFSKLLHFDDGGHISGPGSGRSDSILARVSNGEFVVNAKATKANLPLLHAINDNRISGFADGGLIGTPSMPKLSSADMRTLSRSGGGGSSSNHFHLEGAVVTQDLVNQMNAIGARAADEGASRGFQRTTEHFARQQRYAYPQG